MAKFNIASLSADTINMPPRMLIVAGEKMGKTSFAAGDRVENGKVVEYGLNSPVILPIRGEEGAEHIPVPKFPTAEKFEDIMEAINALRTEEHDRQFLVIDSITTLMRLVKAKVQKDYPALQDEQKFDQYNKGINLCKPYFEQLRDALNQLREERGMGIILIIHTPQKPKTITDPDMSAYDAWTADLPDAIYSVLSRWADYIGYASTKSITKKEDVGFGKEQGRAVTLNGGQRFLFNAKSKGHPSGGRGIYGQLPDEIPFDWASFQDAVSAAM